MWLLSLCVCVRVGLQRGGTLSRLLQSLAGPYRKEVRGASDTAVSLFSHSLSALRGPPRHHSFSESPAKVFHSRGFTFRHLPYSFLIVCAPPPSGLFYPRFKCEPAEPGAADRALAQGRAAACQSAADSTAAFAFCFAEGEDERRGGRGGGGSRCTAGVGGEK